MDPHAVLGTQDIHRADGDGRGCSLSREERLRPVPARPALAIEDRVFCLHCAWSIEGWNRYAGGVREHLDGHPGAGLSLGQDYALGRRYGPMTGKRWRGRPKTLPPLRRRQQQPSKCWEEGRKLERGLSRYRPRRKKTTGAAVTPSRG